MIETTNQQAAKAAEIVLAAMRKMHDVMNSDRVNIDDKVNSANAIARLAASLDSRPHLVFGDINTMDNGGVHDD